MTKKIVRNWQERADRDLESARILIASAAPCEAAMQLLEQALEKGLKGFLVSKGWKLKKIHDLEKLLDEAFKYGFKADQEQSLELARELTAWYMENRYPPGDIPVVEKKELNKKFEMVRSLNEKLKGSGS